MPSKSRLLRRPVVLVGAFVAVATLAVGGGLFYDSNRASTDDYVSTYTPTPSTPSDRKQVTIIGDSYTGGSDMGGVESANWTRLINERTEATTPVNLVVSGEGGSGYVNPGIKGTVFPGEAARVAGQRINSW